MRGGAVEPRTIRRGSTRTVVGSARVPSSSRNRSAVASRAMVFLSCCTVVSGGMHRRLISMSSKPTRDMSWGMRIPSSSRLRQAPTATMSLVAKIAVGGGASPSISRPTS
ncbi:hypothetical protein AMOR_04130 [Anaeromyxobacter oryzae]|uniref:Uncharacterized protein n=1 Tax=Anaeromyxobacter oryzae TaxID=2918170 RepID=A0ABM7WPM7_9BACT|nr:hypothetical protein AMOR_04130 [Anaeromyxobacter oryzae]